MNTFEILINVLEESIICIFLTLYFGCKYKGLKAIGGLLLALIVDITAITYLNSIYVYEAFMGIIFVVLYFGYCFLFLKGDIYTKLFISGFINCIMYSVALFSSLCAGILFREDIYVIYSASVERLFVIILSKVLLIAVCAILLKFRFDNVASKRNMTLLIIMPIATEISTVGITQALFEQSGMRNELFLAATGVMIANFLTYYIFISINKNIKTEAELIGLRNKLELDRKNAKDIEELYNKTCGVQHDLIMHFSTISRLIDTDKDEAQEYIGNVMGTRLDKIKTMIKTDNDCFDAIVNTKIAVCENLGIYCQIRVGDGALDTLRHDEIVILFGNLFDNAIEASKNSKKKIIKLDVRIQDNYVSIFMKNSIDASVLDKNRSLQTTKQNKEYHGFGTKNIKSVVECHNGMMDYDEKDGYFICDILLPR